MSTSPCVTGTPCSSVSSLSRAHLAGCQLQHVGTLHRLAGPQPHSCSKSSSLSPWTTREVLTPCFLEHLFLHSELLNLMSL